LTSRAGWATILAVVFWAPTFTSPASKGMPTLPKNRSRRVSPIRARLDQSLKAYAAAGVGLFAITQTAAAKVVFTPSHQTLLPGQSLNLDLNSDGQNDFVIANNHGGVTNISSGSLIAADAKLPFSNKILRGSLIGSSAFAKVLAPGIAISSRNRFVNYPLRMAYCLGRSGTVTHREGRWTNATNRYLGLQFLISGQPHFGWARFTVKLEPGLGCSFRATLSGYAYESVANMPIVTGQTTEVSTDSFSHTAASLGMLALGASGISIWRREEENTTR